MCTCYFSGKIWTFWTTYFLLPSFPSTAFASLIRASLAICSLFYEKKIDIV